MPQMPQTQPLVLFSRGHRSRNVAHVMAVLPSDFNDNDGFQFNRLMDPVCPQYPQTVSSNCSSRLKCRSHSTSSFWSVKKTQWPESTSELYRQSDRRLSAKLVPTCADRGCRVVIHFIESQTRDMPACSIVPQPLCYRVPPFVFCKTETYISNIILHHLLNVFAQLANKRGFTKKKII
jgi:hypothetical protein